MNSAAEIVALLVKGVNGAVAALYMVAALFLSEMGTAAASWSSAGPVAPVDVIAELRRRRLHSNQPESRGPISACRPKFILTFLAKLTRRRAREQIFEVFLEPGD